MSGDRTLLFDIGNTRVKWGVLDDDGIRRSGSISHDTLKENGFESLTRRLPRRVAAAVACNVAGTNFGTRFARVIGIHFGGDLRYVHSERAAFGVTSAYRRPRSLGVDRWVAMVGARAEFKTALCVVDAGTAITIDAVDKSGQHLGGQIIPGMQLMGNALRTETSNIGALSEKTRDAKAGIDMFGKSTDRAIANGSLNAVCGAVERATRTMRAAGYRPKIVLTGGDASRILTQLVGAPVHRPNLVLQGLAFMVNSEA